MRQECIDTIASPSVPRLSWGQWAQAGMRMVKTDCLQLVSLLSTWHERNRSRRLLQHLSDHALKDVGLSRCQIEAEAQKPFWKA